MNRYCNEQDIYWSDIIRAIYGFFFFFRLRHRLVNEVFQFLVGLLDVVVDDDYVVDPGGVGELELDPGLF